DVEVAGSGEEALGLVDSFGPDVILTDVRMPRMGGLDLLATLKAKQNPATVIVMSAYGSVDLALEAIKAGAYDYVGKPFKPEGSVHRRERRSSRPLRGGRRRHALPRRDRRAAAQPAGEAAPRAAGGVDPAARRLEGHPHRRPHHHRDASRSRRRGESRTLPRGPLLSDQRTADRDPAAPRSEGGREPPRRSLRHAQQRAAR